MAVTKFVEGCFTSNLAIVSFAEVAFGFRNDPNHCDQNLVPQIGVVNSKKLSSSELFSTDFGPKVTDQPRIFPAASIWSCTVASNLENASSLCSSKFNPIKISS